jgi:kinetochore protein Fta7
MARSEQPHERTTTSQKRKSQGHESEEQQVQTKKPKFSSLKAQTRHISQDLVRSEWESLQKPAQQQVRDIFLAAKRTTLNQVLDGPRRREAEFVVNDVLRRLEKQLPRMPFPPNTKAAQLDLDGILEQVVVIFHPFTCIITDHISADARNRESTT